MKITVYENEIKLTGITDFDLERTFNCGQCFRWDADETGAYTGVAFGHVVNIRQCAENVLITCSEREFFSVWHDYFDLTRDYSLIREQLCIDDFMKNAIEYGKGIRILCQDKWETLCSFIISQNNNIPRIKSIINTLCREFGDEIEYGGKIYYTFPSAGKIAGLCAGDLSPLRCGYRAEYIIRSAEMVAAGIINLEKLADGSLKNTRSTLKTLHGVGDKVADCVMLFGFHMLDAFPVDVWMKRAVVKHYGSGFDPKIFTPYAGIAQQYIFHYTRNMT